MNGNIPIHYLILLTILSVLVFIIGRTLRRRGRILTGRGGAIAITILTVAPLLVAGALFWGGHEARLVADTQPTYQIDSNAR